MEMQRNSMNDFILANIVGRGWPLAPLLLSTQIAKVAAAFPSAETIAN
jgi:hypothetical protein